LGDDGGLDPVIHAAARLRITATLAGLGQGDGLSFTRLQSLLDLTAGNLTTHLRKLEEAGYVQVTRSGGGRSAASVITLTPAGRTAFDDYTAALQSLLATDVTTSTQIGTP
jgi:DNA-binding MarR family transcriptional regulator